MNNPSAPVYPFKAAYDSGVYDRYNQLICRVVGDNHFERTSFVAHLINEASGTEPTTYYKVPKNPFTGNEAA